MKLNIYSIFDIKTGAYMRPFFMQSDGQAQRMFGDVAVDAEHEIGKHPEDYYLCRIGDFNDQNGKLEPEHVETICTALEMVALSQKVARGSLKNGEMFDEISDGAQLRAGSTSEHTAE